MARQEATRLREAAIWIGRATAFANKCPVSWLQGVVPVEGPRYLRDVVGTHFLCGWRRKRPPESGLPPSHTASHGQLACAAPPPCATSSSRTGLFAGHARVKPAAAAEQKLRVQMAKRARLAESDRSADMVSTWLAGRTLAPKAPASSAAEGLAALRSRIVAKQRVTPHE